MLMAGHGKLSMNSSIVTPVLPVILEYLADVYLRLAAGSDSQSLWFRLIADDSFYRRYSVQATFRPIHHLAVLDTENMSTGPHKESTANKS